MFHLDDVEVLMHAKTREFDHYKGWSLLNDETGNKRGGRVKLQPMVMPKPVSVAFGR
ncbi:hypothetical protein IGI04_039258 [Brassica rapa subsp. trilocularis]|uniref:Uncharacterized protein n=1 Tax=Brassica rapa subsp. trilocularis TaxID=1813537 RepID=A0ABQ7KJC9_BRACM|nr:hypothetical protein IGI04_039258 [Brassica rapa subsp. trilocularis]